MTSPANLSPAAAERLREELAERTGPRRVMITDRIEKARELGDLKENGDYHAAKDEYGMLNDRKNLVIGILENAEIAPDPADGVVGVLSRVTILFEGDSPDMAETYLIGHIEEKSEGTEIMSPSSPIGSALLGRNEGESVTVTLENGAKVSVTVTKVSR